MSYNGILDETRARLLAIFAHNHNETTRMDRATIARQKGLPPAEFATLYPGTQSTQHVVHNHTSSGGGMLKGALLGAALLAGGAGGMTLLRPATPGTPPVVKQEPARTTPSPPPAATTPPAVSFLGTIVQEEQLADGTWRRLWSAPAKLLPDGAAQTDDGRVWVKGKDGVWKEKP